MAANSQHVVDDSVSCL